MLQFTLNQTAPILPCSTIEECLNAFVSNILVVVAVLGGIAGVIVLVGAALKQLITTLSGNTPEDDQKVEASLKYVVMGAVLLFGSVVAFRLIIFVYKAVFKVP